MSKKSYMFIIYVVICMLMPLTAFSQNIAYNNIKVNNAYDKMLERMKRNEKMLSKDLYGNSWVTERAHIKLALPESYDIDLRDFSMPIAEKDLKNLVITSHYGPRWGRMHRGIDIKLYIGDTVRAAFSGKVRVVKYDPKGYGNYVVIRHHNGLETVYGHMSKHLVKVNQYVSSGEPIGLGGNTGRSTGSHLHFETRLCGLDLNPELFFNFEKRDIKYDIYKYKRK